MLSGCDSFDNTEPAARKGLGSKAASGRFAYEMLSIDFIKDLEISHVGEEAGCFDDIHHGQSGSFQNGFNIFAGLFCLSGNAFREFSCLGIDSELTSSEYESVGFICLGLGSKGCRSIVRVNNFHNILLKMTKYYKLDIL